MCAQDEKYFPQTGGVGSKSLTREWVAMVAGGSVIQTRPIQGSAVASIDDLWIRYMRG